MDSLLYVDTDVLFLRPMDDIWSLFKSFNGTQLAAMAPEHEVPKIGWYSRFARHPFYGVTGVNSGVMLMNLTRIRGAAFKVSSKAWLQPPRLKRDVMLPVLERCSGVLRLPRSPLTPRPHPHSLLSGRLIATERRCKCGFDDVSLMTSGAVCS